MEGFLGGLDATTARGLIQQLTLMCRDLRDEIVRARTEKVRVQAIARFARINAQRIALIEELGR